MSRKNFLLPFIALFTVSCWACSSSREASTTSKNTPATNQSTLKIEAQIIYGIGGPQPVARNRFYLLDADLLDVEIPKPKNVHSLEEALSKMSPSQRLKLIITTAQVNQRIQDALRGRGITPPDTPNNKEEGVLSIRLIIEEQLMKDKEATHHFIQSAATDFQGRATFENIKAGDYWVMGVTETRADYAFWNYKVSIKPGENKVFLSQENALYSK
jgi:hypothetical protein